MFDIIKIIIMSLSITGATTGDIMEKQTTHPYEGTWEWEQSITKGRGGEIVQNPESESMTKQIVIGADYSVKVIENGEVTCESTLIASKTHMPKGELEDYFESDCIKGSFGVIDGQLKQYQYLGCPSTTTTYSRVK